MISGARHDLAAALCRLGGAWAGFAEDLDHACRRHGRAPTLKDLFFSIRDMPYDRPKHGPAPEAVIAEWRGTCSGKHIVLWHALAALEIPARFFMASHRLNRDDPAVPPVLRPLIPSTGVWDVHNFLTADIAGHRTLIDLTWPLALATHGFPVTADWRAGRDFVLAVSPAEVREVPPDDHGVAEKKAWLEELNGTAIGSREAVIEGLAAFARAVSPSRPRAEAIDEAIGRS